MNFKRGWSKILDRCHLLIIIQTRSEAGIKPGVSIQYGGNPCGGHHRAARGRGERKQKPAAGSLKTATSLCSPSRSDSLFCEVERRRRAALSPHICGLRYETEMDFVSALMHRRWQKEGDRRAEQLFLGVWCQISWTFSFSYLMVFITSNSFLIYCNVDVPFFSDHYCNIIHLSVNEPHVHFVPNTHNPLTLLQ